MQWEKAHDPNVLVVRMETWGVGWKQRQLKLADIHFDSPYCNRKLLKALLDEAKQEDAPVAIYGDLFDLMQGKTDRRSDKREIRPEYVGTGQYFDNVLEDAFKFFEPYADILMMISEGNHDNAAARAAEFNVLAHLVKLLGESARTEGRGCHYMGYSGWVDYRFERHTGGGRTSRVEYFHHGSGGASPVTLGVIGSARNQEAYVADIYVGGHNHNEWAASRSYVTVSGGKEIKSDALHINIPSLKDEWSAHTGFHTETGKPPKPIGACWLTFAWHPRERNNLFIDAGRAR